ncbi:MAG: hypothetical protein U0169_25275 [Polyangiaceae bacterium]
MTLSATAMRRLPVTFLLLAATAFLGAVGCDLSTGGSSPMDGPTGADASTDATTGSDATTPAFDGGVDAPPACSADLRTDPEHCGACNSPCRPSANERATCQAGTCIRECETGFDRCAPADAGLADAGPSAAFACTSVTSDSANCGSCGHSCLGGTCTAGVCNPVTFRTLDAGLPEGLTWDDDSDTLYWTVRNDPTAPGGTGVFGHSFARDVDTFAARNANFIAALYRAGHLYVSESGIANRILDYDVAAPPGTIPDTFATNAQAAPDLAADTTHLYWTVYDSNFESPADCSQQTVGSLLRRPLRPGMLETPTSYTTTSPRPFAVAVDGSDVFMSQLCTGHAVVRYSVGTMGNLPPPTIMSNAFQNPVDVALYGNTLFVADATVTGSGGPTYGGLFRIIVPAASGTSAPERMTQGNSSPRRVAIDETDVYWTDEGVLGTSGESEFGFVYKMARGANALSPATILARGQKSPRQIAVGRKAIAWVTRGDRTIHFLAK